MPTPMNSGSSRRISAERALLWVDRGAAWLSAVLLLLYLISGFGMTKPLLVERATGGIITWRVAYDMHNLLHIPLIIGFTLHTFIGLRRAITRVTRKRRLAIAVALIAGAGILSYLLLLTLG